ncbi:hypothetical protein GDO86_016843, partial [Hymenochirus boettgeri]
MRNGTGSPKYKPVDYEQLHAETEAKKLASANIQFKVMKIKQASKNTKDQMLLTQHCQVWWKEHRRLTVSSFCSLLAVKRSIFQQPLNDNVFCLDAEQQLSEERDQYRASAIHPIWQLRDDLKHRISELRHHFPHQNQTESDFDPAKIIEQVNIASLLLHSHSYSLLLYITIPIPLLQGGKIKDLFHSDIVANFYTEAPLIIQEAECPYPDLKISMVAEYQHCTKQYFDKLQELTQQTKEIDRNCSWSDEEHWLFQFVISQYPPDLPNRRGLYLDMLLKHLAHKPREELIKHEKCLDMHRFTKDQRKALMESWSRYRKDFVIKAVMTIAEACSAYETEIIMENDRKKQQEICTELKQKVNQWRQHQEEAARLESAIAAREREQENKREKQLKERERMQRAGEKEKIEKYKAEKQQAWEELQKRDLQRLEQLKKLMAQQAEKDKERVVYRQQLLEKRILERREMCLLEEQEEEDRQRRLEALRQQVAVIAEFDPVRMMSDTKASKARTGIETEEEFFLQKPLFDLHTYSERQIISDPRVRIEMALREAGLHNTTYAAQIMPKISPLKPPRKDMESTVFK